MDWVLAVVALLLVAYVCRRILRLDQPPARAWRPAALPLNRFQIYRTAAQEVETQTGMLSVTLNEALGDYGAGNGANAVAHMLLAVQQWDLLAQLVSSVLKTVTENMPQVGTMASYREINPACFQSRAMADLMKSGGKLHQFIYHSKGRFDFRVQLIRSSLETLTEEFRSTFGLADPAPQFPASKWRDIDPTHHDYDLIAKEALLAVRDFLGALPEAAIPGFGVEIARVVSLHSVRSLPSSSRRVIS